MSQRQYIGSLTARTQMHTNRFWDYRFLKAVLFIKAIIYKVEKQSMQICILF